MFSSVFISYVIYIKHEITGQTSISGDEKDVVIERERGKKTETDREKERGRQRNRDAKREGHEGSRHDVEERREADNINHISVFLYSCPTVGSRTK